MATCANYNEQLLDYLFDLLDEGESAQLRLHLQTCQHCQAELLIAEGQQRLLSQAARACPNVAVFEAPEADAPAAEPATLPMPAPQPLPTRPARPVGNRFPGWLRYGSVALAASLLLGVVMARETYLSGLSGRTQQIAHARQEVVDIDTAHRRLVSDFETQKTEALQPSGVVQLNMTGLRTFDPAAGASYNLVANGLTGNPTDADVKVQVVDAKNHDVLWTSQVRCEGENTKVAIQPTRRAKEMQLVVEPQTVPPSPPLIAHLHAAEPAFATHLALNKTSFFPHETMLFRSLTVDQFSLKPIEKEIPLKFSLVHPDDTVVVARDGKVGAGGIGGGQFSLSDNLMPGTYYLKVASLDRSVKLHSSSDGVQRRRIEILSTNVPQWQVVMDKQTYAPGELAKGKLVGPNAVPIAEQRVVPEIIQPDLALLDSVPAGATTAAPALRQQQMPRTYSDNQGQFAVPLPPQMNASRVTVSIGVPTRTSNENLQTTINIVPSEVVVDFYPEGGDLIDGLPTRVYYQVRSLQGDPVVPDGGLIVQTQDGKILHTSGKSADFFSLTPDKREKYVAKLSSSRSQVRDGSTALKSHFMNRVIKDDGLVLTVPKGKGVIPGNDAIQVRLANKGSAKRLLVLASCRGQIVDQQTLQIKDGEEANLALKPLTDVAGILRVTAFEIKDQAMRPLAERLVFRMPSHRLELAGNADIRAGQNSLKLQDENQQAPADAYVLGAVMDAQFAGENNQDSVTHFFLDNEIASPAELENATVLVRDNQAAHDALDVFLGTQGWRRFGAVDPAVSFARERQTKDRVATQADMQTKKKEAPTASGNTVLADSRPAFRVIAASAPVLVSLQNSSLTELQTRDTQRMNESLIVLQHHLQTQVAELQQQRTVRIDRFNQLSLALAEYERLPHEYLVLVLNVVMALTVAVGLLLLLVGLVRLARQRFATPVVAGSFASFALCLLAMMAAGQLRPEGPVEFARLNPPEWRIAAVDEAQPDWPRAPQRKLLRAEQPVNLALAAEDEALAARRLASAMAKMVEKGEKEGAKSDRDNVKSAVRNVFQGPQYQAMGGAGYGQNLARGGDAHLEHKALAPVPAIPGGARIEDAANFVMEPREYAFHLKRPLERMDQMLLTPATLLWAPAIHVGKNGDFQLNFELPEQAQSSYRVLLQAHSSDGRMGYIEKKVTPDGAAPPSNSR